jgi:6-phosphofructokinase 1
VVAEGAHDRSLNKITCTRVCDLLTNLGLDTRVTTLGHVQRGGNACAYDRLLSTLQGVEAVRAILDATPSTPTYMIGISENKIVRVPLVKAVQKNKEVATAISHRDFDAAITIRGDETREYVDAYLMCTRLPDPKNFVPENKASRLATVGNN